MTPFRAEMFHGSTFFVVGGVVLCGLLLYLAPSVITGTPLATIGATVIAFSQTLALPYELLLKWLAPHLGPHEWALLKPLSVIMGYATLAYVFGWRIANPLRTSWQPFYTRTLTKRFGETTTLMIKDKDLVVYRNGKVRHVLDRTKTEIRGEPMRLSWRHIFIWQLNRRDPEKSIYGEGNDLAWSVCGLYRGKSYVLFNVYSRDEASLLVSAIQEICTKKWSPDPTLMVEPDDPTADGEPIRPTAFN